MTVNLIQALKLRSIQCQTFVSYVEIFAGHFRIKLHTYNWGKVQIKLKSEPMRILRKELITSLHEIEDGLHLTAMKLTRVLTIDLSKTCNTKCM